MDRSALQAYYDDTLRALQDNVAALKGLIKQANALSSAVQNLESSSDASKEVKNAIDAALQNLYESIDVVADKVGTLFENYQKLSKELFPKK
jgi:prefoldin subunit 5